jgi:hypothetical protein
VVFCFSAAILVRKTAMKQLSLNMQSRGFLFFSGNTCEKNSKETIAAFKKANDILKAEKSFVQCTKFALGAKSILKRQNLCSK